MAYQIHSTSGIVAVCQTAATLRNYTHSELRFRALLDGELSSLLLSYSLIELIYREGPSPSFPFEVGSV